MRQFVLTFSSWSAPAFIGLYILILFIPVSHVDIHPHFLIGCQGEADQADERRQWQGPPVEAHQGEGGEPSQAEG